MPSQNLVSATIAPETQAAVLAKLVEIRSSLDFLLSLSGEEAQSLLKVGNNYAPFLDKARRAVDSYPDIMPRLFDLEEFHRDYQLSKDLGVITDQVNQLAESLKNTLAAVNADAMAAALEVYSAVKHNADREPGLTRVQAELAEFFKKSRAKAMAKA